MDKLRITKGIHFLALNGIVVNMKEVVQSGADILREISKEVPDNMFGTDELYSIIKDMSESLDKKLDGVALAAPQISIPWRIFIVRYDRINNKEDEEGTQPDIGVYINPKIIKTSRRREDMDEGCLSVRGIYGNTLRHKRTTVKAQDTDGKSFTRGGGGILAQIFQHEIDHLNGILFIDHATQLYETEDNISEKQND